jgi:hypothetical protein
LREVSVNTPDAMLFLLLHFIKGATDDAESGSLSDGKLQPEQAKPYVT